MIKMPFKILQDIIKTRMELQDNRVLLGNQKYDLPKDTGLFVIIEYVNGRVFSNRGQQIVNNAGFSFEQNINVQEVYDIEILSRDLTAFERKEELAMALASVYAQQLQEAYSFHISRIAPIRDLSALEETARLNRFGTSVTIHAHYEKTTVEDYYDQFRVAIKAEGVPLIKREFTQPVTNLTEGV